MIDPSPDLDINVTVGSWFPGYKSGSLINQPGSGLDIAYPDYVFTRRYTGTCLIRLGNNPSILNKCIYEIQMSP